MTVTINGTTGIAGVDGTAATPAVQGVDTDTGVFYGTDIVGISTGGTERMRINASGFVGIANVAPVCILDVTGGIQTSRTTVTSPAATDGNIFSGTYTPSLSNITNVTTSSSSVCQYMRVGNVVTVCGQVVIDPTTANVNTTLEMSVPIATTFAASRNCAGSGSSVTTTIFGGNNIGILGNSTLNTAVFRLYPVGAASETYTFSFTYQVL